MDLSNRSKQSPPLKKTNRFKRPASKVISKSKNQSRKQSPDHSNRTSESNSDSSDHSSDSILSKENESNAQENNPIVENQSEHKRAIFLSKQSLVQNKLKCNDSKSTSIYSIYFLVLFVFFTVAATFVDYYFNGQNETENLPVTNKLKKYQLQVKDIKENFPGQSSRFWKTVKLALEPNLRLDENDSPAVLLLASNVDATVTSHCLAKKLSSAFSMTCKEYIEISGTIYKSQHATSAKKDVDKIITEALHGHSCSVLMSRFESLPPYSTTNFYQFCENDNAPYKNAAFIFTIQVEPGNWNKQNIDLISVPEKLWDIVVDDYLTESLKSRDETGKMTDEMISGLLSRITPSVVWVNKEPKLPSC